MDCPVCNKKDITIINSKCPQCDANLSSLEILHKLKSVIPGSPKKKWVLILFILLIVVNFIALIYLFEANQTIAVYSEIKAELQDSLNHSAQKIDKLLLAINNEPRDNGKEITYKVKRNDSLWKIARIFYGKGSEYIKIKKHNKLNSDFLSYGQTLKIVLE